MPKSNKNRSLSLNKTLNEPTVITLQKQIDSYISKVEIEKRRKFNLEQNHELLKKEMDERQQKVNQLKRDLILECQESNKESNDDIFDQLYPYRKQQIESNKKKQIEATRFQIVIDKYNQKYCHTQASIESIKDLITQQRQERGLILQSHEEINSKLQDYENKVTQQELDTTTKFKYAENTQQKMFQLKSKNEEEKSKYIEHFDKLKQDVDKDRKEKANKLQLFTGIEELNGKKNKKQNEYKNSSILDTSTLLRRRLQRIIANNKDKIKLIDTYQRNMRIIDEAFNQIKEATGLTDINEIQSNFIKSEEQNYALWTYVDILNQEIDKYEDENKGLDEKCHQQEKNNAERLRILQATPDGERKRKRMQSMIDQKQVEINEFQQRLAQIQPLFEKLLRKLIHSKFNQDTARLFTFKEGFTLNESNIDTYLAELEGYLDKLFLYKSKKSLKSNFYTTGLLLENIPQKIQKNTDKNISIVADQDQPGIGQPQGKFLGYEDLKQQAKEYLEINKKTQQDLNISGKKSTQNTKN
ncbi:hypothetical protein pb186bvf_006099 [Paramecium bursaria]